MKPFTACLLLAVLAACSKPILPKVQIRTSIGKIVIEVDTIHAPVTATNFLKLVDRGTYQNASFYRVVDLNNQPNNEVKIEVIQGGLNDDGLIASFPPIAHETTEVTGLEHRNGTVSMARNEPGTASTEFFICLGKQHELDFGGRRNPDGQGFAAFGQVTRGMDVVLQIQQQAEHGQMLDEPVRIYTVERLR